MRRALFAAATGALGALGAAGLMSATPAQAACDNTPIPVTERPNCLVSSYTGSFLTSIDPGYNLDVLLNGNEDSPDLGLLDQPATFQRSVGDFLNGPRGPGGPPAPDATPPGTPPA